MSDLTGEDAFDRLLDVALESKIDVMRARDARDAAQTAQREAERLAVERADKISRLEQEKKVTLPKLAALWIAADRVRMAAAEPADLSNPLHELEAALDEAATACDQIPF